MGDQVPGRFYTDENGDFAGKIAGATYQYYLRDVLGEVMYHSNTYRLYEGPLSFDVNAVAQSADFGEGLVQGRTMQITVIPEPSVTLLLGGVALLIGRRRR